MFDGSSRSDPRIGYLLVAVSALGFSTKSVLVKLAFGYGVDPLTFMLMRLYVGLPLFFAALFWKEGPAAFRMQARELGHFALVGLVGLGGAVYFSFAAIFELTAATATLLVYTYPALTILLTYLLYRKISAAQIVAVVVTFAGLALVLRVGRADLATFSWIGFACGLASALCFASYNIMSERIMRKVSPLRLSAFTVGIVTIVFAAFFGAREYPREPAVWGLAALLGSFSGFLSFLAFMYGVRILGAGRTAILNSVGPLFTLFWAFLFLGELLDGLQLFGGAAVVAGVLALRLKK